MKITLTLDHPEDIQILDAYLNRTTGVPFMRIATEPFIQKIAKQVQEQLAPPTGTREKVITNMNGES